LSKSIPSVCSIIMMWMMLLVAGDGSSMLSMSSDDITVDEDAGCSNRRVTSEQRVARAESLDSINDECHQYVS